MGYDIYCSDEVIIAASDVEAALAALRKLAQQRDGEEGDDEPNTDTFEELVTNYSGEVFFAKKCDDGSYSINTGDDSFRHLNNGEELMDALAPFLAGQSLYFKGEDDEEWAWEFIGGKRQEDYASKVWGEDKKKVGAFDEVLEILYPNGKVRTKFPKDTLDKLATSIRKSGFGPFGKLSDLEALAKAAE
jgi:hypothetical protein